MTRGRKRKLHALRTPQGRLSRSIAAQDAHLEPIATRQRLYDLSEESARDQKASSFVGRLQMRGTKLNGLSIAQYDAAVEYRRQREAYRRALSAPDSLAHASRGGTDDRTPDEHAKWCSVVIAKFDGSQRAVQLEQCVIDNRGKNLFAALDYLVLRDQAFEHLVGDLRIALNALVRHYAIRA